MDRRDLLIESGLALSSELSLDAVLQRIIELAARITGARYGALGVLGPEGRITDFVTTGITREEREAIGALPVGRGILGVLIRDAKPLRLADISTHPLSVGFPSNHPRMRSFLGAPIVSRGRVFGNIYLTEKQGAPEFSAEDEEALIVLASQAGVAVENARLYEEARRRERWLDAVREIATLILAGASAREALELIARRAMELAGADLATVATPEPGGKDLKIRAAVGEHASDLEGQTFPMLGSVSGEVIRFGRAAILEDASTDERTYQPIVRLGEVGPAIFVPLSVRGEAFGTLVVANLRGGRGFGDEDLRLVEAFATQAATALEYDRAQQEIHRLAVLEDRERIAKELHDGVIQSLFAVGMGLQGTAALSKDPELEQRIEGAVNELDRVIRDLRNYIFGLRPGILADRQLDQALRDLAVEFQEKSGVLTVVDVDENIASELSPSAADVIQIVREALSNVGRHAEASTCRVSLRRGEDGALLEIDDDGRGFDPDAARTGDGLLNVQNRAGALGGKASIESSPAQGTTVRVTLPLD